MPQRTCGTTGCSNAHRAKGLCSSCYNRQYQPSERHRKNATACTICGKLVMKQTSKRYRPTCSNYCRWFLQNPVLSCPVPITHPAHPDYQAPRPKRHRAWVAGRCGRCQAPFVSRGRGDDPGRYCSERCKRRTSTSRRRARKRSAVHIPYSRVQVFERDGYRCHLCKGMTKRDAVVPHPRAPVIDHLVPLGVGDDAMHNVATAHFLCNSTRREVGAAQLILFG